MEHLHHDDTPERPALTQRSLGACLALKGELYRAVWNNAGFACKRPNGSDVPEPTIHGEPAAAARDALLEFKFRHKVSEDVWDWMLDVVVAAFESDEYGAERDIESEYESWRIADWMQGKLKAVHLAWLMSPSRDSQREAIARAVIEKEVARIIRQAVEWMGPGEDEETAAVS